MATDPRESVNPIIVPLAMDTRVEQWGLTKREYFAAMAMQGIIGGPLSQVGSSGDAEKDTVAVANMVKNTSAFAVRYADALIEALNKEKE